MNWHDIIETAGHVAGTQRRLAQRLGMPEQNITNAKRGARGLPDEACVELANLLGIEWGTVIAARNAALAKSDEEREFWLPFAQGIAPNVSKVRSSIL